MLPVKANPAMLVSAIKLFVFVLFAATSGNCSVSPFTGTLPEQPDQLPAVDHDALVAPVHMQVLALATLLAVDATIIRKVAAMTTLEGVATTFGENSLGAVMVAIGPRDGAMNERFHHATQA